MERAYVTQIIDNFHVKIRIPSLNKAESANGATPAKELYTATVTTPHGVFPKLSVGDVVVVDFEMDETSLPIIVGTLFNNVSKSKTRSSFFGVDLNVNGNTNLGYDTTIGKVLPASLKCLENLQVNVQTEFELIHASIDRVEEEISALQTRVTTNEDILSSIEDKYVTTQSLAEVIGSGMEAGTFNITTTEKASYKIEDLNISKVHNTLIGHSLDRSQHVDKSSISNSLTTPTSTSQVATHEHSINQIYGIRFGTVDPTDANNGIEGKVDGELYFLIKE